MPFTFPIDNIMPLQFPGDDPLDFSFSTPSSDGLETMSSDEESTSSTRLPPLGQFRRKSTARAYRSPTDSSSMLQQRLFPILEPKASTLRSESPDSSFSRNAGSYVTKELLTVLSSYRKSPLPHPNNISGGVGDSYMYIGNGGGDAYESNNISCLGTHYESISNYNNNNNNNSSTTSNPNTRMLLQQQSIFPSMTMDRSLSPQNTTATVVGELFGSLSMAVSPTQASLLRSMRTPKPPPLTPPLSPPLTVVGGVFTPTPPPLTLLPLLTTDEPHRGNNNETSMSAKSFASTFHTGDSNMTLLKKKNKTKVNPHQMKHTATRVTNKHRREHAKNTKLRKFIGEDSDEKGVIG